MRDLQVSKKGWLILAKGVGEIKDGSKGGLTRKASP
jgi:hypothetical protein